MKAGDFDKSSYYFNNIHHDTTEHNKNTISHILYYVLSQKYNKSQNNLISEDNQEKLKLAETWLYNNPLNTNADSDYESYLLYLPLYLYYTTINEPDMASQYLNLAYKIIDKALITEFNNHPDGDNYPKFFYCRDIIEAYNANIR